MINSFKVVDVFAGCGGLSLGFQNAGYEIVAAFDNWAPAIAVYNKNFNHHAYNLDLSKGNFSIIENLACDVILGGPPCQDYSQAGRRNESLGRASLTISYAELIAHVQPKWFVMENVERCKNASTYKQARKIFKSLGYGLTETVLDASRCGAPQKRKRFICIGRLNGQDGELLPILKSNQSKTCMSVRDYFGDSLEIEYYYRHPRSYQRRAIFSIDEPSPTIRGVNRPVPKGRQPHKGDASQDKNIRALTYRERASIQTFPDWFDFDEVNQTKTDLEQMIGNAVPPKLGEYIANCILKFNDYA